MRDIERFFSSHIPINEIKKKINNKVFSFEEVLNLALTSQHPIGRNAAWAIAHVASQNVSKLQPFVSQIINTLPSKKEGHQRELLKILTFATLNEEQEGRLFALCVTLWEQTSKPSSVRYYAFCVIFDTIRKYPPLQNEFIFLTDSRYLDTLSQGIKKSIEKKIANIKLS